jgi:hypothetical protein
LEGLTSRSARVKEASEFAASSIRKVPRQDRINGWIEGQPNVRARYFIVRFRILADARTPVNNAVAPGIDGSLSYSRRKGRGQCFYSTAMAKACVAIRRPDIVALALDALSHEFSHL